MYYLQGPKPNQALSPQGGVCSPSQRQHPHILCSQWPQVPSPEPAQRVTPHPGRPPRQPCLTPSEAGQCPQLVHSLQLQPLASYKLPSECSLLSSTCTPLVTEGSPHRMNLVLTQAPPGLAWVLPLPSPAFLARGPHHLITFRQTRGLQDGLGWDTCGFPKPQVDTSPGQLWCQHPCRDTAQHRDSVVTRDHRWLDRRCGGPRSETG